MSALYMLSVFHFFCLLVLLTHLLTFCYFLFVFHFPALMIFSVFFSSPGNFKILKFFEKKYTTSEVILSDACSSYFTTPIIAEAKDRNSFWCLSCANVTQDSCDENLNKTICPKADSCILISTKTFFTRKCANSELRKLMTKKGNCKKTAFNTMECSVVGKKKYRVSWCKKPGCKAGFWCSTCQSSSPEACDASSKNSTCPKADSCMVFQSEKVFARKCVNKAFIDKITNGCLNISAASRYCNDDKRHTSYQVAWCDRPGCKAEIPSVFIKGKKRLDVFLHNSGSTAKGRY